MDGKQQIKHFITSGLILKFKRAHLKFSVYGRKQTDIHAHARAQCSHASVGLAQARPNQEMTHTTCKSDFHRFFRLEPLLRGKISIAFYKWYRTGSRYNFVEVNSLLAIVLRIVVLL